MNPDSLPQGLWDFGFGKSAFVTIPPIQEKQDFGSRGTSVVEIWTEVLEQM
jgi:hypothetical protein